MDLLLIETLNGGDIQLVGNDIAIVSSIENMPYISMFGGNPGFVTKSIPDEEQSFDWWGNNLLMKNSPSVQMNSLTEKELQVVALNSAGRVRIENAVKKDLDYLKAYGTLTVSCSIISDDNIKVEIKIVPKDGLTKVKIVNFRKKADGDFYFTDFNNDFNL